MGVFFFSLGPLLGTCGNDVEILGRIRMSAVTKGSLISIVSSIDDVGDNNERKFNMPNLGRVDGHG